MTPRRICDRAFLAACLAGQFFSMTLLLGILAIVVAKGIGVIDWTFLTSPPAGGGRSGGIGPAILGTLLLVVTTGILAAPLALGLALVRTEYFQPGRVRSFFELVLYTINGVPSILFGLFGYEVIVNRMGLGKSWLAGGLVLAVMILPTIAVSIHEQIEALPPSYRDQARALGLNRAKVIWSVVLPQTLPGILTGTLLGLGRASGETAPIMMTAAVFTGVHVPTGIRDNPVLALPYHLFVLAQDSHDPASISNAWGTALVLLGMAFLLTLASLPFRVGWRREEEAR